MTVFVLLKTFFSIRRKCVKYFALGLTLKSVTGNESYKVNKNKLIRNADFSFNSLTTNLFPFFLRIKIFYKKNIQCAYNFYGTDLYVNVFRGVFRTQSNICGGTSLQKSRKSFIVEVLPGSKYPSGVGFTLEKVCRMSICQFGLKKSGMRSCLEFLEDKFLNIFYPKTL